MVMRRREGRVSGHDAGGFGVRPACHAPMPRAPWWCAQGALVGERNGQAGEATNWGELGAAAWWHAGRDERQLW